MGWALNPLPDLTREVEVGADSEMRFSAPAEPGRSGRLFGGQVMARALAAASLTVPSGRTPYHLHAQFVQGGRPDGPTAFEVEASADLSRFNHRQVRATQGSRHLLDLSASFQQPESGPTWGGTGPVTEGPDDVPSIFDLPRLDGLGEAEAEWVQRLSTWLAVEIRCRQLPGRTPHATGTVPTTLTTWVRSYQPMPDDPIVHQCGAVYVSDIFLLTTALGCHGLRIGDDNVFAVTLDHSMWFHAPVRLDDWLRYEEEAIWTGGGRLLCRGQMFDRNGTLVATTTQGGLLRVREGIEP